MFLIWAPSGIQSAYIKGSDWENKEPVGFVMLCLFQIVKRKMFPILVEIKRPLSCSVHFKYVLTAQYDHWCIYPQYKSYKNIYSKPKSVFSKEKASWTITH